MAKLKTQMTGRTSISYKRKFQEMQKKYQSLLESKIGIAEIQKPEEAPIENNQNLEETPIIPEIPKPISETPIESPILTEQPKELEIIEEKEDLIIEKAKENPDDYDFRCSNCKELFMAEGNVFGSIVKCPDCGMEFDNA